MCARSFTTSTSEGWLRWTLSTGPSVPAGSPRRTVARRSRSPVPGPVVHPLNGTSRLDGLSRDELIELLEAGGESFDDAVRRRVFGS
jgi:hypothetical protein